MSLLITWRNPQPPARVERKVTRLLGDQFGSVYLVTRPDTPEEAFELYPGGGTTASDQCRAAAEYGRTTALCASAEQGA